MLCVCFLSSVLQVRFEKSQCGWCKVEFRVEFFEQLGVRDGVIGLREVNVESDGWFLFACFVCAPVDVVA